MLNYTERLRQVPTAVINIALDGGRIVLDGSRSLPSEGSRIVDHVWSPRPGNPAPLSTRDGLPFQNELSAETLILQSPQVDGESYLQLRVKDETGREDRSGHLFRRSSPSGASLLLAFEEHEKNV